MTASPPRATGPEWTREAVAEFLRQDWRPGQRIALPHGLLADGEDLSPVAGRILTEEVRGKTVLDVGCAQGFYCLEALRRGAAAATGADGDPDLVQQAMTIAAMLGSPVDYRLTEVEEEPLPGRHDWVLCLNLLHQVRDPIALLDRLTAATRERLVLGATDPTELRARRLLRQMGARWLTRWIMKRLPLAVIGRNGSTGLPREIKFYFTSRALEHLLLYQRTAFARCETFPSPQPGRSLLIAHKRQIGRLLLVTGPSACGKTTAIRCLMRGEAGEIARACDFDPSDRWESSDTTSIHNDGRIRSERLLYHYDLLRPWHRHARLHRRVEGLDVLDCSARVQVVTLLARTGELRRRIEERLERLGDNRQWRRDRLLDVRQLYRQPEKLAGLIRQWIVYCGERGIQPVFVDNSEMPPRLIAPDEWERVVLEN